jgi:hypothetical protein
MQYPLSFRIIFWFAVIITLSAIAFSIVAVITKAPAYAYALAIFFIIAIILLSILLVYVMSLHKTSLSLM